MRRQVMLGILSGALVAFAISLVLFLNFMHHMFIVGTRSPIGMIVHATPVILMILGIVIGIRALRA